jgi:branched-chain amino acid transport system ATP-binding protein
VKNSDVAFVDVRNLDVNYGSIPVLWDINMRIHEGKCVALLGLNGAGKSTLLKTIAGLIRPRKGTIMFKGERIDHFDPWRISEMGVVYVPEGRGIFTKMTCKENLLMGCYSKKKRKRAHQLLMEVYKIFPVLKERENQEAGTMSGGEQQMLAIARGLMADPELLMLDEVTQGLAPKLREGIYEKIKQLKDLGITILLVDEYLNKSIEVSDYVYILVSGNIVSEGKSTEIVKNSSFLKKYFGVE